MNIENLKRIADYIETIPQDEFSMEEYRTGDWICHKCDSVGCIIGHATALDKMENIPFFDYKRAYRPINFQKWSENFTGISYCSEEWHFLFGSEWVYADNTAIGAAKRIRYFLNNGLPDNWREIMNGEEPLPY